MASVGSVFSKLRSWHLLIILAVLYGLLGIYQIIPLRPQSIHQWAQCDRASVAWNYYKGYADFFHPHVNNTDNGTGITGLEFPIVQYFVSLLYRVFGFHEWLYRLTTLIVFTIGATSVFRLSLYFIKEKLPALVIMLMYVCSPLLTFYSCSFIPDIYSLSFAMTAWAFLVSYAERPVSGLKWMWFATALLACLIKPNSMIHLPVMWLFLYRNKLWTWKQPLRFTGFFASVAGLTIAWYVYASWLSKTYGSEVFLLQMRPPQSGQEVRDVWAIVSSDWLYRIYHPYILASILLLGLLASISRNPLKNNIAAYSLVMLAGCCVFLTMMLLQLSYHDYYFITVFPVLVFFSISICDLFHRISVRSGNLTFSVVILLAASFQFYEAKTHLRTAHKASNWKYGAVHNMLYFYPAPVFEAGQLTEKDQVIIVFDHSPNIALYLLGLRGVSIPYRNVRETMMGYLNTGRYRYVIYNRQSRVKALDFDPADYPLERAGEWNGIDIFKVSSSFHPDGRTVPLSPWN